MKRVFFFFLFLFITGCSSTINRGYFMTITLSSEETSGYIWRYNIEDDSVIFLSEEEYIAKNGKDISELGGDYKFSFKSVSSGNTKIYFNYINPSDNTILYSLEYEFLVDSDNKINLVNKGGSYLIDNIPEPMFKNR